jgi:hypothetical protein
VPIHPSIFPACHYNCEESVGKRGKDDTSSREVISTTGRPLMDNPKSVSSRNSYFKINDCKNLSNLGFSKISEGLEISQNSKKDICFQPSWQELA